MLLGEDGYFRRFRFPDADLDEVRQEIGEDRAVVASAAPSAASPVILTALIRLGSNLIPMGCEAEAAAHLEAALAMARQLGERDQEISALLHLATARQYLGERERAQVLFQAGEDRSADYGIDDRLHFLLHHRGRCYAEQDRIEDARECLEQALTLRLQMDDPRFITSSRNALDDLDR